MRSLIFNLAKELNRDICYRCKSKVNFADFSIEHKIPWAWKNNSLDLFMDYKNIAISHKTCNSGNVRNTKRRKLSQKNKRRFKNNLWKCSKCDDWKTKDCFHNNKSTISGKESMCKSCRREYRSK